MVTTYARGQYYILNLRHLANYAQEILSMNGHCSI